MSKHNIEQEIIPAVSTMKDFEWFLDSEFTFCILMYFHISLLEMMIKSGHAKGKKMLLHLDLIHGLSSDEYGCEYACQRLKADGIISTKSKVLDTAKKNHKLSILRLFLIDTKSFEKGMQLCNTLVPDFIEILPAIAYPIFEMIKERTNIPVMGGGLIKTPEQIAAALEAGAESVTISDIKLIKQYT